MARHIRETAALVCSFLVMATSAGARSAASEPSITPAAAERLGNNLMKALTAEACASAKPYLSSMYRMPWSLNLERSRKQAITVGLGPILAQVERKWASKPPALGKCPADRVHNRFMESVRAFDRSLDIAIEQALARTPMAAPGTSRLLVKALVDARWGLEFSTPRACAASHETELVAREKARREALRVRLIRQGRRRDLEAADKRWAAEKVKWDRDTATFGLLISCGARKLQTANDHIDRVSANLRTRH
jgi:hypothetical protein